MKESNRFADKDWTSGSSPGELRNDRTNDLLMSQALRTNELQVWFLDERLVSTSLVVAKQKAARADRRSGSTVTAPICRRGSLTKARRAP